MNNLVSIVDRFEIEALRGEFTDAGMMYDYERLASLFTEDGVYRIPDANIEQVGREQIRTGSEGLKGQWDYFMQTTHPGMIQLHGDIAVGRAYVSELIRLRDGSSYLNDAVFHDRYQRTKGGWKFAERVFEVRYSTPRRLPDRHPRQRRRKLKHQTNPRLCRNEGHHRIN
jgi:ketosteroid isomerase-like protein